MPSEQVIAEQRDRVGHVINATVKKQTHDHMVIDLGNNAESPYIVSRSSPMRPMAVVIALRF